MDEPLRRPCEVQVSRAATDKIAENLQKNEPTGLTVATAVAAGGEHRVGCIQVKYRRANAEFVD